MSHREMVTPRWPHAAVEDCACSGFTTVCLILYEIALQDIALPMDFSGHMAKFVESAAVQVDTLRVSVLVTPLTFIS